MLCMKYKYDPPPLPPAAAAAAAVDGIAAAAAAAAAFAAAAATRGSSGLPTPGGGMQFTSGAVCHLLHQRRILDSSPTFLVRFFFKIDVNYACVDSCT